MSHILGVRRRFMDLHREGTFVVPNPWDVGSARLLADLGFAALATTSSGHAAALGKADQQLTRQELITHVRALTDAVAVPVSVDAEHGFAESPSGVAQTVELLADAGASGASIEDYNPSTRVIEPLQVAVDRVAAAAEAADRHGMVLTARAENHLYLAGSVSASDLLPDTIDRLRAYAAAGAGVVYAPGLTAMDSIERLVASVAVPVNVLALRGGPSVPQLAAAGVRRVSTGGALAWVAYGALIEAARELAGPGSYGYLDRMVDPAIRARAFGG